MSERLNVYKRRIKKAQQGIKFVSYNVVEDPVIDYTDITNPINPFSEYYIPTTYNTEQALVVPEREDSKSDTVEETPAVASKPIAEPVVNKPVASKVVVDTANSTWSSPYKDRSKWMADLTNAYKRAGITNDNAIRMLVSQDALESAWGRSAQGKFNFGNLTTGAKWKGDYVTGNDKNAKGEAIKQKFRSYNSMDEYAADKVQFLKRLYDFDENDDINKFVAKLTGSNKGKRRYAEARNYAKLLTGVYNGISKGQNGLVVQRRDAIKDYTPQIPLSPIKRTYMPTQLPVLSQDNRTGWEKEVSEQIKEEQARNNNLYNNQHIWNWSAPFNNTRTTKSNAGAMFDFNKSAAMSTFATGMGIANPTATATSMVGSLVGAGIGNKVAGDKGALVGGFIGGMLGDRAINAARYAKNANKNMGVVSDYYKNPNNPLLSEVDWRGWSKGGEISKEHLAEYAAIERAAKANGTWLKTRDGEPWQGDKRTWIQLMSKDGEKFRHGEFPSNRDVWYNGVPNDGTMLRDYPTYTGDTWLADRYEAALPYSKTMKGQVFHIGVPKGTRIKGFDAHGDKFSEVRLPDGTRMKTDRIVDEVKATGKYDATYIKDVDETWGFKPNDDLILHSGTPRKSLIGNNGDFDLSNPNIYKALMPFLIGGTTYGFNKGNVDKQTTKKNN
jgi:flagellum-specific peptidoglycan hydrolase FlgJ